MYAMCKHEEKAELAIAKEISYASLMNMSHSELFMSKRGRINGRPQGATHPIRTTPVPTMTVTWETERT
jgi:hypothetical protein